jgi:hypothetical protein
MLGDRARLRPKAGIEVGLSTAGLIGRKIHGQAEVVEDIHNRLPRLRVERVDQAGDEQLDVGHESILS